MKVTYIRPDNWINCAWLKIARESRALSIKQLCDSSGISSYKLKRMEKAFYFPSKSELDLLCTVLNYPKEFFLREENPDGVHSKYNKELKCRANNKKV